MNEPKLPFEYPQKEALRIYLQRFMVFLAIVLVNLVAFGGAILIVAYLMKK